MNYSDELQQLGTICKDQGLTFQLTSLPRPSGDFRSPIKFNCVISNQDGSVVLVTPFSVGTGHAVDLCKVPRSNRTRKEQDRDLAQAKRILQGQKGITITGHVAEIVEDAIGRYAPDLDIIVGCLLMDASCVDGYEMDDWLQDMSYTDSMKVVRQGEAMWRTIQDNTKKLKTLLGDSYSLALELAQEL